MIKYKELNYFLILSLTLFLGFYLKDNSSGGSKIDFYYLLPFVFEFSKNFKNGIDFFLSDSGSLIHSPLFYIIIGNLYYLINNLIIIKLTYILISCYLPYVFYLILKENYETDSRYIFFFSLVIFFSPYFRSSAIWLLGDNLSLIFLGLSIYFFKRRNNKKLNYSNYILCLVFLIMCSYIRYYYSLLSIFYLIIFFKELNLKKFLLLVLICLLLSLPALFYFYYIFLNYEFSNKLFHYGNLNFFSNVLIISSIIFFYLVPFLLLEIKNFKNYLYNKVNFFLILSFIIYSIFLIDFLYYENLIVFSPNGGGVFMKLSNLLGVNSVFFLSTISVISFLVLDFFFKENRIKNYFLLSLLILMFPIFTIYQKYFDPLFFLFFFGLMKLSIFKKIILKEKNYKIIYIYFISFLIFSSIYNNKFFQNFFFE